MNKGHWISCRDMLYGVFAVGRPTRAKGEGIMMRWVGRWGACCPLGAMAHWRLWPLRTMSIPWGDSRQAHMWV